MIKIHPCCFSQQTIIEVQRINFRKESNKIIFVTKKFLDDRLHHSDTYTISVLTHCKIKLQISVRAISFTLVSKNANTDRQLLQHNVVIKPNTNFKDKF